MELVQLVKKIKNYEFSLILNILQILKARLIYEYFSSNNVEIWYCYIHDQGFLLSYPKNQILETIYTHTCCNYCNIDFINKFDKDFIKNFRQIEIRDFLDYKLKWFIDSFYDYKEDKFVATPLAVKLFYESCLTEN